jgi:hypothetical protein
MEAGTMGDNIDLHLFVPRALIFDHIGGIVECKVHHRRIVLIDLDGTMYFAVGREAGRGERHRCERNSANEEAMHDGAQANLLRRFEVKV